MGWRADNHIHGQFLFSVLEIFGTVSRLIDHHVTRAEIMRQPAQALHGIKDPVAFDGRLLALKCGKRIATDDAVRRAARKLLIILDCRNQFRIIDVAARMRVQHLLVLCQIASRRMSRNQRNHLAELVIGIARLDDAIQRDADWLGRWRLGIRKLALQRRILLIARLETMQIGSRIAFRCQLFENGFRIDTVARQIVETTEAVCDYTSLTRIDGIAQRAGRHANFKFCEFLLALRFSSAIEIVSRDRDCIFIRVEPVFVRTGKESRNILGAVEHFIVGRPHERALT